MKGAEIVNHDDTRIASALRSEPLPAWTRDVAVGDVVFQLVRRSGSAFVGMLRMGRVHGGELYGYIARMNSERSEVRLFPRHVGWHGNAAAVDALLGAAMRFHAECVTRESVAHG
jgi:hypothetical protein